MYPVLVRFGQMAVYSYGVMLALAFVACWLFARWYLPSRGLDVELATDLLLAAAAGGIIGARALYVATNWGVFAANPLWVFQLQRGGMVFYGGLVGGALAVAAYVVFRKLPVPVIADGGAIAVLLGSAIGRIGCFLNGCCAGRATDGLLGVLFPGGAGRVYPAQLIDSGANLLIFAALLHIAVRHKVRPGVLWWLFLTLYGVSRFLMEALRTNPPLALGLTQAQLISLPVVVVGLVGLAWMARTGLRTGGGGDHD
jgi:phosphatidylglycerol:prolipoprotein diacylglycerol transferase